MEETIYHFRLNMDLINLNRKQIENRVNSAYAASNHALKKSKKATKDLEEVECNLEAFE
jgi:hypothetical protein